KIFWSFAAFLISSLLVCGNDQVDDEWIDPYDMLNYDSTSKSTRKPIEVKKLDNVPTKRREYSQDACQVTQCPDVKECTDRANMLQRQLDEHRQWVTFSSQQPSCNPVFKRFLAKLLKEISKLSLPNAVTAEMHYDAEVKLSKQMLSEIQKLVNEDSSWRTGTLDEALSNILINFKHHDYEAWRWRFEDTFGVEPDTVIKLLLYFYSSKSLKGALLLLLESCFTYCISFMQVHAFIQFIYSFFWSALFALGCTLFSYKGDLLSLENGRMKIFATVSNHLTSMVSEWFRTTWTLQDDPCKQYYETLIVNPILLMPPNKVVELTMTALITDHLEHLSQGIDAFLRGLLDPLSVRLHIPLLFVFVLSIMV
ncbi:chloride channel CLIC-like protein 1 isoform X3, partial [Silurus asotus]